MPKAINVMSLIQARDSLSDECMNEFLDYFDLAIKDSELDDIKILLETFEQIGQQTKLYENFYIGYEIPQIGKEFDLLRFGVDSIINIEIKSESTEYKIKKQLLRNKYYLDAINLTVYSFAFVSKSRKFYSLDLNDQIIERTVDEVYELLDEHVVDSTAHPDNLFDPSLYLVSPFNSTKNFLNGNYFLTNQQEKISNAIFDALEASKSAMYISIEGAAGTGKTLLTYDIAKNLIKKGWAVLIIHCGKLNNGHQKLISKGWNIKGIKDYTKVEFNDFDLVIVDEAQRVRKDQLEKIISYMDDSKGTCIFSHDGVQILHKDEKKTDASTKIKAIPKIVKYQLSDKIRSNKEVALFIKMLFFKNRNVPFSHNENILLNYFHNDEDAKDYLSSLSSKWEVLQLTTSIYLREPQDSYVCQFKKTSHEVIGQEFDNVVITIDKNFAYDEDGELYYKVKSYYEPKSMLFQNITRARKKINVVIINNELILKRCLQILK